MLIRSAVLTATLLLLLTAIHTASAVQAGANDLPHPCSLVTQAEVENAMGKGATMTRYHNPRLEKDQCRLKGTAPGLGEVIIMVQRADMWDATKKALLSVDKSVKQVPGLGDDAFSGRAIGYNVKKGNKYVQIFGEVTNKDTVNEKATRFLAEKAASRL